ncbi:HDL539Cp [Eremothecium sinecaudum]|uniref:HDL539Cp n=1 Tax=Eremothecium sinecaudum TaxID=45286 RepID=A0A120K226_9SACH|nr:HDL539Cp [Eremothecium sinecaudum]AMD20205.1 HDL539Cp [Eremothecium sinecaudum]
MTRSSQSVNGNFNARPVAPFVTVLRSKLKQPQFYWFLGHFLTLYHYFRYSFSFAQSSFRKQYSSVLFYIIITYGIVLYQFYKSGQLKVSTLKSQLQTLDNLQYFVMTSILWCCSGAKVISMAMLSPVIFALFHSLNYFKENLLPFLPLHPLLKTFLADKITFFITNYNEKCLMLAQNSEFITLLQVIMLLPIDFFSLLWRFNVTNLLKLTAVATYAWFFKLRYMQSPQMKAIVHQYDIKADQLFQQRAPQLTLKWQGIKSLLIRFFSIIPI